MTPKEKFVLRITLHQLGVKTPDIIQVISDCEKKRRSYTSVMKALKRLEDYFINERLFDKESFAKIISTERIYTYGIEKIKTMEETFRNHCYSEDEIKTIETGSPEALGGREEALDEKLSFYGVIGIKNLIINHPANLRQGLALSYARHKYLSSLHLFDNHEKELFIPETHFVRAHEIDNKTLKEKYPIVEGNYLVKQQIHK